MDNREKANELVMNFGKTLTVEGLELGTENNSCVLVFDGDIILNLEYDEVQERMLFSVYLDELPDENAEPILRELLGANLYWHQTRGATLCLEKGTDGVIMVYPHSIDLLNDSTFETLVQNIVDQAEHWKNRIAILKKETTPSDANDLEPSSHNDWVKI